MIKLTESARLFFSLATIVLLVICMYFLRPILAPLSFSFIFAVILLPPTLFLERRGLSPTAAALITVSLTTLLAFGGVIRGTWQVSTMTDNSKNMMARLETCTARHRYHRKGISPGKTAESDQLPAAHQGPFPESRGEHQPVGQRFARIRIQCAADAALHIFYVVVPAVFPPVFTPGYPIRKQGRGRYSG